MMRRCDSPSFSFFFFFYRMTERSPVVRIEEEGGGLLPKPKNTRGKVTTNDAGEVKVMVITVMLSRRNGRPGGVDGHRTGQ